MNYENRPDNQAGSVHVSDNRLPLVNTSLQGEHLIIPPTATVVLLPTEILEFGPPSFLPSFLASLPPIPGSLEKKWEPMGLLLLPIRGSC
jgi:hypothetical protein